MPRFAGRIDRDKVRRSSVASRLESESSSYSIETPLRTEAQNHASLPLTQTLLADSITSPLDAAISWDGDACPPVVPRTYIGLALTNSPWPWRWLISGTKHGWLTFNSGLVLINCGRFQKPFFPRRNLNAVDYCDWPDRNLWPCFSASFRRAVVVPSLSACGRPLLCAWVWLDRLRL